MKILHQKNTYFVDSKKSVYTGYTETTIHTDDETEIPYVITALDIKKVELLCASGTVLPEWRTNKQSISHTDCINIEMWHKMSQKSILSVDVPSSTKMVVRIQFRCSDTNNGVVFYKPVSVDDKHRECCAVNRDFDSSSIFPSILGCPRISWELNYVTTDDVKIASPGVFKGVSEVSGMYVHSYFVERGLSGHLNFCVGTFDAHEIITGDDKKLVFAPVEIYKEGIKEFCTDLHCLVRYTEHTLPEYSLGTLSVAFTMCDSEVHGHGTALFGIGHMADSKEIEAMFALKGVAAKVLSTQIFRVFVVESEERDGWIFAGMQGYFYDYCRRHLLGRNEFQYCLFKDREYVVENDVGELPIYDVRRFYENFDKKGVAIGESEVDVNDMKGLKVSEELASSVLTDKIRVNDNNGVYSIQGKRRLSTDENSDSNKVYISGSSHMKDRSQNVDTVVNSNAVDDINHTHALHESDTNKFTLRSDAFQLSHKHQESASNHTDTNSHNTDVKSHYTRMRNYYRTSPTTKFYRTKSKVFFHVLESNLSKAFMDKICNYTLSKRLEIQDGFTHEFLHLVKDVTGKDLQHLFETYIFKPGVFMLRLSFSMDSKKNRVDFNVSCSVTSTLKNANRKLTGSFTVKAYEIEGVFEHSFSLQTQNFFYYHTRTKKKKKTEDEEEEVMPLLWIRGDPKGEPLFKVVLEQPDYMYVEQLLDKNVPGQLEALRVLCKKPSTVVCEAFERVLENTHMFYKVRVEVMYVLARTVIGGKRDFGRIGGDKRGKKEYMDDGGFIYDREYVNREYMEHTNREYIDDNMEIIDGKKTYIDSNKVFSSNEIINGRFTNKEHINKERISEEHIECIVEERISEEYTNKEHVDDHKVFMRDAAGDSFLESIESRRDNSDSYDEVIDFGSISDRAVDGDHISGQGHDDLREYEHTSSHSNGEDAFSVGGASGDRSMRYNNIRRGDIHGSDMHINDGAINKQNVIVHNSNASFPSDNNSMHNKDDNFGDGGKLMRNNDRPIYNNDRLRNGDELGNNNSMHRSDTYSFLKGDDRLIQNSFMHTNNNSTDANDIYSLKNDTYSLRNNLTGDNADDKSHTQNIDMHENIVSMHKDANLRGAAVDSRLIPNTVPKNSTHPQATKYVDDTAYLGFQRLIYCFIKKYCFQSSTIVKPNDFTFISYFLQKHLIRALCLTDPFIFKEYHRPDEYSGRYVGSASIVTAFVINLLMFNDNSMNVYSDGCYITSIIESLTYPLVALGYGPYGCDEETSGEDSRGGEWVSRGVVCNERGEWSEGDESINKPTTAFASSIDKSIADKSINKQSTEFNGGLSAVDGGIRLPTDTTAKLSMHKDTGMSASKNIFMHTNKDTYMNTTIDTNKDAAMNTSINTAMSVKITNRTIKKAVQEIERYRILDMIVPSHKNLVTQASIYALGRLAFYGHIGINPEALVELSKYPNYSSVRTAALETLVLLNYTRADVLNTVLDALLHDVYTVKLPVLTLILSMCLNSSFSIRTSIPRDKLIDLINRNEDSMAIYGVCVDILYCIEGMDVSASTYNKYVSAYEPIVEEHRRGVRVIGLDEMKRERMYSDWIVRLPCKRRYRFVNDRRVDDIDDRRVGDINDRRMGDNDVYNMTIGREDRKEKQNDRRPCSRKDGSIEVTATKIGDIRYDEDKMDGIRGMPRGQGDMRVDRSPSGTADKMGPTKKVGSTGKSGGLRVPDDTGNTPCKIGDDLKVRLPLSYLIRLPIYRSQRVNGHSEDYRSVKKNKHSKCVILLTPDGKDIEKDNKNANGSANSGVHKPEMNAIPYLAEGMRPSEKFSGVEHKTEERNCMRDERAEFIDARKRDNFTISDMRYINTFDRHISTNITDNSNTISDISTKSNHIAGDIHIGAESKHSASDEYKSNKDTDVVDKHITDNNNITNNTADNSHITTHKYTSANIATELINTMMAHPSAPILGQLLLSTPPNDFFSWTPKPYAHISRTNFHASRLEVERLLVYLLTHTKLNTKPYNTVKGAFNFFEKTYAELLPISPRVTVMTDELRGLCCSFVESLGNKKPQGFLESQNFEEPSTDFGVFEDPVRNFKGYTDLVRTPMCLQSVRERLSEYGSVECFLGDMNQIWKNCLYFNSNGSEIAMAAVELRERIREFVVEHFGDPYGLAQQSSMNAVNQQSKNHMLDTLSMNAIAINSTAPADTVGHSIKVVSGKEVVESLISLDGSGLIADMYENTVVETLHDFACILRRAKEVSNRHSKQYKMVCDGVKAIKKGLERWFNFVNEKLVCWELDEFRSEPEHRLMEL